MNLNVTIKLTDSEFEIVCKITIASMFLWNIKITKSNIISTIKHQIHQSGEYYINFTSEANSEGSDYYYKNSEEIDKIYNKYFN